MASLIPGFEYDIFISYRQKDNKGDRWVSKFVEALKTELESTFKEEISVYFDVNPHDGLLETHDVDASLKNKLKCLVFIPVISQTYCDPKCFAWEHEFKAFIEQASNDQFGLMVKLPSGNVANRVLPVRIHELDSEDIDLCEAILGGVLRGIEFIYKEPGVNRPLTIKDNEKKNSNRTSYRNQINKVANAIKELFAGLKKGAAAEEKDGAGKTGKPHALKNIEKGEKISKWRFNRKSKKWLIISLSVFLSVALSLTIFKIIISNKNTDSITKLEKSIAVLPFINDSPDQENGYFINGIMDEVLNNLQKISDFRVLSRTSTEQFRGTDRPGIPEIAKKLDVNFIVEGSGQKYGNTFRIRVQLIATHNEKHLWAESYEQEIQSTKDIFGIQSHIAEAIAAELKATITPEEKQRIEEIPTANLTAYDFYRRGKEEEEKLELPGDRSSSLKIIEEMYRKALENDPAFGPAYAGLALVYWWKHGDLAANSKNILDSVPILCDIALSYDNKNSQAYLIKGDYYHFMGKEEQALKEYDIAIKYNPNDFRIYWSKTYIYNDDIVRKIQNFEKAIPLSRGRGNYPGVLFQLTGDAYSEVGLLKEARNYYQEYLNLIGDSVSTYLNLSQVELFSGNINNSIQYLKKAYSKDSIWSAIPGNLGIYYMFLRNGKEALKYFKKALGIDSTMGSGNIINSSDSPNYFVNIGWAYRQNGFKEKAEYYINKQIEFSSRFVESGRTDQFGLYFSLASAYAERGEKSKSFKFLENYNQKKVISLWDLTMFKQNPVFDSLREEPEFKKFLKDAETKYQAEHERVRKWLEEQGKL
jgi:TolB-like protein